MLSLPASANAEKIRAEVRAWLKSNTPPDVGPERDLELFVKESRGWQKKLSDARLIAVHWPTEFGGRSLSLVEEAIIQEELGQAAAPQVLGLFGLTMVGPVLIKHGTQAQKEKYLSRILSAQDIWCQGFSEPEAGSDLSNLKTTAVAVPGGFKITGQKIWTSFAQCANYIFVLARTSVEEKKHKGLTYFLLPMDSAGITVRPLRQITGDAEFNEVFFEDVFVPTDSIVGTVGEGWSIAISTLMYERVILTFARHVQSEVALRELIAEKNSLSVSQKLELADQLITAAATRALAYKHLHSYSESGAAPGPEGSLDKLLWSTSFQSIVSLGMRSMGLMAALGSDASAEDQNGASRVARYLYSRGRTIAAGTSEIQKNIIADRILGLKP